MKLAHVGAMAVALALLLAMWFWWSSESPRAATATAPVPAAAEPERTSELELATTAQLEAQPDPDARAAIDSAPASAPQVVSDPSVAKVRLRGRVVVIETDGTEDTQAAGTFDLALWKGERGSVLPVEFAQGAWDAELGFQHDFDELSIVEIRVGPRPAQLEEPSGRFKLPASGELVLRARRSPPAFLRVVDAESHLDLDGVELVSTQDFPRMDVGHPGSDFAARVVARGLSSPVALDAHYDGLERYRQLHFFVGAPEHAWQLVQIEPTSGGETLVPLQRGADLSVTVRGVDPAAHSVLRLRMAERYQPIAEIDLSAGGVIELEGLVPGEVRVVAEIGESFKSPLVLGERLATLRAGERAQVDLVLEAAPTLAIARGAGTVFLPKAWGTSKLDVQLELLDTPLGGAETYMNVPTTAQASAREGFSAFHWEREGLQVGRYRLALGKPPYGITVELPPQGREDLDLEVPPPAELSVLVVDEISGQPVALDELNWSPVRTEDVTMMTLERAFWDEQAQLYRIRAPATQIELSLWAWRYQPYGETLDLRGGLREHTVRLKRGCGLNLKLVDGETPVAFPRGWDGALVAVVGSGHTTLSQFGQFERKYMVSESGTYSIELPQIPGFVAQAALEVDIAPGEFVDRIVELEREH